MHEFELAPIGTMKPFWWILFGVGAICLILALTLLLSRPPKLEVSSEGLRIRQTLFGRTITASQLRVGEAHAVNFGKSPELQPKWRTMGVGLPGYQAGWFRLNNGEKSLVFLTDRGRTVYIPTTEGYSLLVTPKDPDEFLSSLRTLGQ
jgi:hypothetical protein